MPLSDIVNVQITRQTQSVSEVGFGTLMILGATKNFNDRIRRYANMQEVSEDFQPYDKEFIASQDVFAQQVTPPFIYIGRRTVDTVGVVVETALPSQSYTVRINSTNNTINSAPTVNESTVTLDSDLVTDNRINVSLNGTIVGIVTSDIVFSTAFTGGEVTTPTVNGVALTPVPFNTDNATTLSDIATELLNGSDVASAVSDGTDTITVVFTTAGNNTVDSVITVGGAVPVATISEGAFLFNTNNLTTMTAIASAIQTVLNTPSGTATVVVSGASNNVIEVNSNPTQAGVIDFFTVTAGASQAVATIVNLPQATSSLTIAAQLVAEINGSGEPVTATDNLDGTFSITADVAGVAYTISVTTNIANPDSCRVNITQIIPNQAYTVRINGTQFVYQAPNDVTDNLQISANLVAEINTLYPLPPDTPIAKLQPVTATDNLDGSFEIVADSVGTPFLIQITPADVMTIQKGLIIDPYVPSASVVNDLIAIQNVNDDWYALACTDRTSATVQAIAAWIETQVKIFGTTSLDVNIIDQQAGVDTTSIAYIFATAGYARTFVMYHQDADDDFPECAWFGNCLPFTPGSETWKFKTLNSISYSDLTSNQANNAFDKNANTYQYVGGVGITQNGTVAVGEFIDIIRGVDWLTSTIQSYVYSVLVNTPKVPYTNAGITQIESQIRRALQLGVSNDFIASEPPYQIFVPDATTVPSVDKANRILNNVKFQATLAGAIQAINITGTVSV